MPHPTLSLYIYLFDYKDIINANRATFDYICDTFLYCDLRQLRLRD